MAAVRRPPASVPSRSPRGRRGGRTAVPPLPALWDRGAIAVEVEKSPRVAGSLCRTGIPAGGAGPGAAGRPLPGGGARGGRVAEAEPLLGGVDLPQQRVVPQAQLEEKGGGGCQATPRAPTHPWGLHPTDLPPHPGTPRETEKAISVLCRYRP